MDIGHRQTRHAALVWVACYTYNIYCAEKFIKAITGHGETDTLSLFALSGVAFTITGSDRIYHASRFILSSFFLKFSVCPVCWTKLTTRQLFRAR